VTLHARGDLVVVDVVVNDAKRNPVHGLKASDFTLLEDKVSQQVTSFEEHRATHTGKPAPMPVMPPGMFTNYTPAPADGPMNILLLDALNTPPNAQAYVRKQSSNLLDDPRDSVTDFMVSTTGADPMASQMIASVKQFESEKISYELQARQLYTLAAMNQLARYVGSIPGRKNLIWFSGSFPLNVLPDGDLVDPFSVIASAEDDYRETTNLLARGQVAVYPIDARGVVSSPVHAASSPQKSYASNPHAFARDEAQFQQELYSEHGTMSRMAEDTGGRAFMDTDGLTAAVAQAIESGSNYYTLTYAPSNKNWNGRYRKIEVKLVQQGMTLAYRRGYFADDPQAKPNPAREDIAATAVTRESPMSLALMRGGPTPTEILLKLRVLPASTATEDKVAEGNELNPAAKVAARGPFRRYVMDMAADPGAVNFTKTAGGNYECTVEFVIMVYDRDGMPVDRAGTTVRGELSPSEYVTTLRTGVPYHAEISVPARGEFFVRTAVHDLASGRVGAVEIPVAAVAGLAPRTAPDNKAGAAAK
jgi:VWFA-related protein